MTTTGLRRSFVAIALLGFVLAPLRAQTADDGGLWLATFVQGRLGQPGSALEHWRFWFDGHYRLRDEGRHLDVVIPRLALGYALTDDLTAHVGYAPIVQDPVGRDEFLEHRLWEQSVWSSSLLEQPFTSRTRLEQRFVETDGDTGWRLRQMLRTTLPLDERGDVYVPLWDEMFFDLNDTDWGQRNGLRQNRAFAGIGCFLGDDRRTALEIGYLNQWIDRPGEDRLNHVLSINFFLWF